MTNKELKFSGTIKSKNTFFYVKSVLVITCILFIIIGINSIARAGTIDDLKTKIGATNLNRTQLEAEIAQYQKQINDIQGQSNTLKNTIASLDISRNKLLTEIKLTQNKIDGAVLDIEELSLEINNKDNQIDKNSSAIGRLFRQINETESINSIEAILSTKSLSDLWTDIDTNIQLQTKIREQIDQMQVAKKDLQTAKQKSEKIKKDLLAYQNDLQNQKLILESAKKEKNTLLTQTKNTESNYKKILAQKLALKEAFDQEIAKYESQLKLAVDPKSLPTAGKGILVWPLDSIRITQNFGKTVDSARLYVSGTHNGVDFAASIGTKVKSAGNGVIAGTGDTDIVCSGASFGKWVFIRYDNGLASIYGHLSLITAKTGNRVNTGDVVGYSGNTGYSTGPHLHMSVYASQGVEISTLKSSVCKGTYVLPIANSSNYLDPLLYL